METSDKTHMAAGTEGERVREGSGASMFRWRRWMMPMRFVVAAVGAVITLWLIIHLRDLLIQALVATILAAGITPLTIRLTRFGLPRGVSVLLFYLLVILAMVGLGFLLVPQIVGEVRSIVAQAPDFGAQLVRSLDDLQRQFPFLSPLGSSLQDQVKNLGNQAGAIFAQALNLLGVAIGVFGGLLSLVLTLLITFYLVADGTRIRAYLISFLPPGRQEQAERLTDAMGARMGGWLVGQIVLSAAIGVASVVALLIIGVQNALLLGVIAAVAELVPLLGPWIAAVPAVLVAFAQDPLKALFTIIAYVVIQQLESNVLAPRIMGRAVRLHPLAVILALLAGASLFGVIGALVSVPVAAAIGILLDEVHPSSASATSDTPPAPSAPVEVASDIEPASEAKIAP